MENFFYIKIIDQVGKKMFVSDIPGEGIIIDTRLCIADLLKFETYTSARTFMRQKKLEKGGAKVYIRDASDVINEEGYQEEILGQKSKNK